MGCLYPRQLGGLVLLVVQTALGQAGEAANAEQVSVTQRSGWFVAESRHFQCWVGSTPASALDLAQSCEAWRSRLCEAWGVENPTGWLPRCEVIVHPHRAAYAAAIARPGDVSVGSTRMQIDGERIVWRRIDLRCDAADWTTAALPHELSHVVLAERFHGRPLPPWADEGMAMLSESPTKLQVRLLDLQDALRRRPTYTVRDLLSLRSPPPAHLRDAFYGQSFALTAWLVARTSPQAFARFVEACQHGDIDRALQAELSIAGVAALEQHWRDWTRTPEQMTVQALFQPANAPSPVAAVTRPMPIP
jgi:hypothetical protein